jgi:hypothetical protein
MQRQAQPPPPQNPLLVQWIIWGALFATYGIYGYICFLQSQGEPIEPWNQLFLLKPLLFMSAIMLLLSHLLPKRVFMGSLRTMPPDMITEKMISMRMVVPNVISWALTESVAIYGLILVFRTKDITPFYIFGGIGALNMLILRPNPEKWMNLAKEFTQQQRRT